MDFLRDIKSGTLMIRKSPGIAIAITLIIGISIGAITSIYALVDAVILKPLPVKEPQQLVLLKWNARRFPKTRAYIPWFQCANNSEKAAGSVLTGCSFSMPFYRQIESEQNLWEGIFGFAGSGKLGASINGYAYIANGEYVSGGFFTTLGIRAFLGRNLSPQDDVAGATPVTALSYRYWDQELRRDKSVLGRPMFLNGVATTIVGVMPPDFVGLDSGISMDLWLPLSQQPVISKDAFATINSSSDFWWLSVIGRLKEGVDIHKAEVAIDTIFSYATDKGRNPEDVPHIKLVNAAHGLASLNLEFSRNLFLLLIAASGILLISCANVAGLLLSHSSSRKKEMAVRLALGATTWKLLRQIYLENLILLASSSLLSIFIAWWGATALAHFLTENLQLKLHIDIHPDVHLFGSIFILAILSGFIFVLPSAMHSCRIPILQELKESSSHTMSSVFFHRRLNLGGMLVILQVTVSIAVLFTASLLLHSLTKLESVDIGFNDRNVLLIGIDPTLSGYNRQQMINLYGELQNRISSTPGVTAVSYSEDTLFSGNSWAETAYFNSNLKQSSNVYALHISPDFLATMKIPLLAGRDFQPRDMDHATLSTSPYIPVIINQTFAKQFGEQSPLGQHISLIEKKSTMEIIGIAGDTKYGSIRSKTAPMVYLPFVPGRGFFEIRSNVNPMVLIPALRRSATDVARAVPLFGIKTQTQEIEQTIYQERLLANISLVFAFIGLGLACVGLYGLLSYQIVQQIQEIGVRLALGASQGRIFKLVIIRGITLVIAGEIPGIALALGMARYVRNMLYNVPSADPFAIITTLVLFIIMGALACYFPAHGAMKVDAVIALRNE
ncbi:MAG: hypothetical protein DMG65_19750 [Candidatus Angelobacter sp. Gp1-AA117]|nr:MAG: hypothetical protein DMG65_19750 [Candidatus Angelobacter sp. Gp1-AA117]